MPDQPNYSQPDQNPLGAYPPEPSVETPPAAPIPEAPVTSGPTVPEVPTPEAATPEVSTPELVVPQPMPASETAPEPFSQPSPEPVAAPTVGDGEAPATVPTASPEWMTGEPKKGLDIKKILPLLLVFIIFGGLIFAGYKLILPRLSKTQGVTLTYWGLWEPETMYSAVINDYQQSHPQVKISYVQNSPKDYRQRLQSALARNEGPDIFRFHNTWVPMLKKDLAAVPATVMDSATFEASYYPVARMDLRQGNNYVGIPLEIDGLGLYLNEEIFERGGKTIPAEITWDEFRKMACDLTTINAQDEIEIAGAALGRTENVEHWSDVLALMMIQNEADLGNPTGKRVNDTFQYFTMFTKRTAECPRTWDETLPDSTTAFAGGKLAMYFAPSWEVFEIKKISPSLRFRVIAVPQLPGSNLTWASYWVEGVGSKSQYQKEAWEFVKYLSEKTTMQKLFEAEAKVRLFGEPYSRMDMASLLENDLFAGAYIKQANAARSWYLASRTFDNGLNDSMITAFAEVVDLMNEGKAIDQALETLAQKVSQLLAQYQITASVVR